MAAFLFPAFWNGEFSGNFSDLSRCVPREIRVFPKIAVSEVFLNVYI